MMGLFGLLQYGGDVNATDHARQTALHWAAVRGSTSVADVLMEHGARVEAADVNGYRVMWHPSFWMYNSNLYILLPLCL